MKSKKQFKAIQLLCRKGYGEDAGIVLRSMVITLIDIAYIQTDRERLTNMYIGYGDVRFDLIIPALKKKGFKGPINIEREITGEQQKIDILLAIEILKPLL